MLEDLALAAKPVTKDTRSDPVPVRRSDAFRSPIIDGVSTREAATRLGIGDRAVIGRGSQRASQLPDRRWVVDASQLPPVTKPEVA